MRPHYLADVFLICWGKDLLYASPTPFINSQSPLKDVSEQGPHDNNGTSLDRSILVFQSDTHQSDHSSTSRHHFSEPRPSIAFRPHVFTSTDVEVS